MAHQTVAIPKIRAMYEYLSSSALTTPADLLLVYGRLDPRVPTSAAELFHSGWAPKILFAGGIGKDSGWLTQLGIPESHYMALVAKELGVPAERMLLETKSTNGGEVARESLDLLVRECAADVIVLTHPTSLRRLVAVQEHETEKRGLPITYQRVGSQYSFNPSNRVDQAEAIAEILRMADWPAKGWAKAQDDLPSDLVEYARHANGLLSQ